MNPFPQIQGDGLQVPLTTSTWWTRLITTVTSPHPNDDKFGEENLKCRKQRKRAKANKGKISAQGTQENKTREDHGNLEILEHRQ